MSRLAKGHCLIFCTMYSTEGKFFLNQQENNVYKFHSHLIIAVSCAHTFEERKLIILNLKFHQQNSTCKIVREMNAKSRQPREDCQGRFPGLVFGGDGAQGLKRCLWPRKGN